MQSREDIDQGIARLFFTLRKKRGWSKLKMANLLEIDDKTWSRYEDGKTSPSVGEFLWICNRLGEDALKPVLDLVYPDTYKVVSPGVDVHKIREAASHYFLHVASDKTVREMDYIVCGGNGSSFESQMQEFTIIDHLPLEYRVLIARMVKSCWDIAVAKGEIIHPEAIMPDIDMFDKAIEEGHKAAVAGLSSYAAYKEKK